jgi:hypothetical protein
MAEMELAEVSAAKDLVMAELEDVVCEAGEDRYSAIDLADTIVEKLMKAGVLIPEWMPKLLTGEPAQGYYPTVSQVEAWEGRTAMPALLSAVEKVLALHKPETRFTAAGYEEYSFDTREEAMEWNPVTGSFIVCEHCGSIETDDDPDRSYRDSMWPCATVRALQDAIGGQ